ncbi:hypothetical protein [Arthrobacter sp. SD76]|uniref:hypothetical protein n=1 Tax=Arthrobacter sp. SD76 TaxID=3415007 RepID=UPI003C761641
MLTAYIITATDHHFTLPIVELPQVRAKAANDAEIPGAVLAAAAEHTGMAHDQFTVVSDY